MTVWTFLMLTAQCCFLLAGLALLIDLKRTLREIDSHLVQLGNSVTYRLAQLAGSTPWTGGPTP
jgi:hypothetical protein